MNTHTFLFFTTLLMTIITRTMDVNHFSPHVLNKHAAMESSKEFKQYEEAKITHQKYNTTDTEYILNLCKVELSKTKEYQEWVHATEQEKHVIDNIRHSENIYKQKREPATELKRAGDIAWKQLIQTREFKLYQRAQLAHKRHNNADTLSLLTTSEQLLASSQEAQIYAKIQKQLQRLQENNHFPSDICFDYAAQSEAMQEVKRKHGTAALCLIEEKTKKDECKKIIFSREST